MSLSDGIRERSLPLALSFRNFHKPGQTGLPDERTIDTAGRGKQLTVSESHRFDRRKGHFDGGGPFFTSRVTPFVNPSYISNMCNKTATPSTVEVFDGPVYPYMPSSAEMGTVGNSNPQVGNRKIPIKDLEKDGATAISLCNPVNPAANLGTSLAESFREGVPSLPGIQLWKAKTEYLKSLGSEYLNYQFAWEPLRSEVSAVRDAAHFHSMILKQYHKDEGSNVRRRFDFPLDRSVTNGAVQVGATPYIGGITNVSPYLVSPLLKGERQVSRIVETRKWFEGCFTYALPSSTTSWNKAEAYGSDAQKLFGLTLTPSVLWELTPWSWAVDWFSNAGRVINNVTTFGSAGLVMRYGFLMEETREIIKVEQNSIVVPRWNGFKVESQPTGSSSCGYEIVTKKRSPASPFGFGIGWEGLSPTQLAITAALGITRLL
jgi:hypothetical protein